ncbi:hypothetical protein M378DRAFT_780946 [Amanita muscaria Koide BX008]|uniref:Uncharacterized protein n=1 Tax=Amanita muscaria (strain Koide BX008) TaxID=946122 RepID=A0A0C2TQ42_AMAMK|nr:hypothetical protein M378DRAFT_780946 [Amanita muscaria Koide BX008]
MYFMQRNCRQRRIVTADCPLTLTHHFRSVTCYSHRHCRSRLDFRCCHRRHLQGCSVQKAIKAISTYFDVAEYDRSRASIIPRMRGKRRVLKCLDYRAQD